MRISTLLTAGIVSAALAGTALAAAPGGKRAGYDPAQPTARADVLAKANARFDRIDTDNDGMIDAAEMTAHREQMKERMAKAMAAREARMTDEQKATWRERRAERTGWAARGTGEGGNWLARMDTDNDGMISRDEFTAPALKRFDRADADGDGIVTPEERAAAREARKARRS
jgi:phage gpG-like protein